MTQKNKNILLVAGFIIGLIITYQLAFSQTFAIKRELNSLKEQSVGFENLASLSSILHQREKFADSVLNKNNFKNISVQNNLLEFLNDEATGRSFSITNFKEPHIAAENNIPLASYQFTLQGNFNELLEVIYKLEQAYNFGKISHVSFEKKRNHRQRKDYLECSVIIESFVAE